MKLFTEESREEIVRSMTNHSKSKQTWTFSRQKRFNKPNPNCPYVAYEHDTSTLSTKKPKFGTSRRKIFTEASDGPSSWIYRPNSQSKNITISFANGRQEVQSNSYINQQLMKNPGPGDYSYQNKHRKGYTMRPKTAKNRTYFVENKEQADVPGPGNYEEDEVKITGKNFVSKFKSAISGMLGKTRRFPENRERTPSAWKYNNLSTSRIRGGRIGTEHREAFTDKTAYESITPGPGNYKLPTEFGNYKKIKNLI